MTPYYDDGKGIVIYHGDCRLAEVRKQNCFRSAGNFYRAAIQIGCDTSPFFLSCITLPFFRHCWLEIANVGYKGRLLMTGDVAMLFGFPPKSKPGAHVIPGKCMDPDGKGKQSEHPTKKT